MGNNLGLKLTHIDENNILKDVSFIKNKKIIEYVHFITKINRYHIQNYLKHTPIKEFTILNIFTRKEYNIAIDYAHSSVFFDGLSYNLEEIPHPRKFLKIIKVLPDSPSTELQIEENVTLLLGNEKRYFDSIQDVEMEIQNKNANFIFYNLLEDKTFLVKFEKYRNIFDSELKMGFECQEIPIEYFQGEEINVNNITKSKVNIISSNSVECEHVINSRIVDAHLEKLLDMNEKKKEDATINGYVECVNTMISNNITPSTNEDFIREDTQEQTESSVVKNEPNEEISNPSKIISPHTENKSNNSSFNNDKYNFLQIKPKYSKHLSIYERIDSNYNYMSLNKQNDSIHSFEKESSKASTEGIKASILIKGYHLSESDVIDYTCLKIFNLNDNTVNIN